MKFSESWLREWVNPALIIRRISASNYDGRPRG